MAAVPVDASYRDRILAYLGSRDPLVSLEESGRRVRAVAERLGPAGLARPYAEGKWTGAQVLAHLADTELGFGFRIRQILAEDGHLIQPFDQEQWARWYGPESAALALQTLGALRAWNLALLRQLAPADRAREAHHPERGPETLDVVIRLLAGHELNHLAQLEKIR
jgi:hypothetical protein